MNGHEVREADGSGTFARALKNHLPKNELMTLRTKLSKASTQTVCLPAAEGSGAQLRSLEACIARIALSLLSPWIFAAMSGFATFDACRLGQPWQSTMR